jgi:hypothetical protein
MLVTAAVVHAHPRLVEDLAQVRGRVVLVEQHHARLRRHDETACLARSHERRDRPRDVDHACRAGRERGCEDPARQHVDPRELARALEPARPLAVQRQRPRDLLRPHAA